MKVEGVSLPVPQREIRELKDSGGTSSGVCVIFSTTCFTQWRIQACLTLTMQRICLRYI